MLEAIRAVQQFTQDLDTASFSSDQKVVAAVAYHFVILGEAARHVPVEVQARYPLVPWAKNRGMRNVVAHEYRRIDVMVLWQTIQQDLPPIVPLLAEMLRLEPPS